MKIGELLFELGFKADTMKLKDFGKAISELNMTSIVSAGSFSALYEGAKAVIGIADEMALGVNKFGRETGQSTTEIQKWNKMAEQMGVSAGVVTGSVERLQDGLFRMKITGEGSNIWGLLGLDPTHTENMFQVLTMLRDKLKGMTTDQQRFFLENIGLSTEMLNIFKLTDKQWADIAKIQAMTIPQLDQMAEYHQTMVTYSQNLKDIWADLGVSLSPISKGLMDIANSIDANILKSERWKLMMGDIGNGLSAWSNPGKIWKDIKLLYTPGMFASPYEPPAGFLEGKDPYYNPNSTPRVSVNVKNTIHTKDPNTTVDSYYEPLNRKDIDDASHDRPAGSV